MIIVDGNFVFSAQLPGGLVCLISILLFALCGTSAILLSALGIISYFVIHTGYQLFWTGYQATKWPDEPPIC